MFKTQIKDFFERAWGGYSALCPDASIVHEALRLKKNEVILNDHVAFRTFGVQGIDRSSLGRVFEQWGYCKAEEELCFPDKKLKASFWLPPSNEFPKVFISELELASFPIDLQDWARGLAAQALARNPAPHAEMFFADNWQPVSRKDYERFSKLSEYAGWTGLFGIQVNHFTVRVNALTHFITLESLNEFIKAQGIVLSTAGGEIKGQPQDLLQQSSTMARWVPARFADGQSGEALGCYYEFALRYPEVGTGSLFEGFRPANADKIFESNFSSRK